MLDPSGEVLVDVQDRRQGAWILRADEWTATLNRHGFDVERSSSHKLALGFASWVERMNPPDHHVAAIRSLQQGASQDVREALVYQDDGSFAMDVGTFEAVARPG